MKNGKWRKVEDSFSGEAEFYNFVRYCILKNKVNIFIGLTFLWYSFEICLGLFS